MNPYVKHVRPLDDYRLEVVFENSERRIFDVTPYLHAAYLSVCRTAPLFTQHEWWLALSSGQVGWI